MAVCISVIGKDNGPLLIECANLDKELEYHLIVNSSLDIVEERVATPGKVIPPSGVAETTRELYLGVLTAQEDYKVFGYMTNTKIKYIIIMEESTIPFRENDIRTMFRKLHGAYCDLMSNPFYQPGTKINSRRFNLLVGSLMAGK